MFVIWVCTRDSTFLHSTFNFDLCNIQVFAFDIQLFISSSQVFEFDLRVQRNVHSLFRIQHLAFVLQVFASHDFGHCTCKFPYSTVHSIIEFGFRIIWRMVYKKTFNDNLCNDKSWSVQVYLFQVTIRWINDLHASIRSLWQALYLSDYFVLSGH